MTGQNNKTQSTKRKNRSEAVQNSSKNKSASKNTRSSSNNKNTSVSTENEELKRKISELESKNNELTKQNKYLQFQVDSYENSQSLNGDNESQDEVVSDDSSPPAAKRQMRKKQSDEKNAKSIIKTLLKTFPELELKTGKTFGSKENDDICQKLIPELQKAMKEMIHGYNPSYEQVKAWLKSIHRSKRSAFLKSSQSNPTPLNDESDNSESDSAIQSAKRQTRSKIRKPNNLSEDDDELKNEESKNDDGSKIEEGAKKMLRRLLNKTYTQDEYKLKFEYTFKNQENADICKKLIPKLQEGAKPAYNLSYKQVEFWLQSIHKTKRNHYLKSNQMDIDEY